MIAHVVGRDYRIKNTMTSDSNKYKIVDDRVVISENSTCELTVHYTGRASDLCDVGEYIFIPSRDSYSNFFQIVSCDTDYANKTVTLHGDSGLLWWYSQGTWSGQYGHVSEVGRNIAWYLSNVTGVYPIRNNEVAARVRAGDTTASTAKEALNKTAELFGCSIHLGYTLENGTVTAFLDITDSGRETGEVLTVGKELSELNKTEDCSGVVTSVYLRGVIKPAKNYDSLSAMTTDHDLEDECVVTVLNSMAFHVREYTAVTLRQQMINPNTVYKLDGTFYYGSRTGTGQTALTAQETYNGLVAVRLFSSYVSDETVRTAMQTDYDSGDYYSDERSRLVSRSAWSRYGGDGLKLVNFGNEIALKAESIETTDQAEVLERAIEILDANKDPIVTYDCECNKRVEYGAYYTLCVPDEGVYISARCLEIEESETAGTYKPTFGNFLKQENAFEVLARNM